MLAANILTAVATARINSTYRVVQKKTAQSLWHHNFATVHHTVMRFSAKCSEKNSLHD